MKRVKVTITTDKPVNVKITPCRDALDEIIEMLEGDKVKEVIRNEDKTK